MTTRTFGGDVAVMLIHVTGQAIQGCMLAGQDKLGVMIKVADRIHPVVAGQAVQAKEAVMFRHEGAVGLLMARCAIDSDRRVISFQMAAGTGQRTAVIIQPMFGQTEGGEAGMIKERKIKMGDFRFRPFMFGVAALAMDHIGKFAV